MVEVVWTDSALSDLNEIAEYIALDKISAANKLVRRIFSRVEKLCDSPHSGRKPPELGEFKFREVIVGPCRIFYRVDDSMAIILYVMRSERQLKNYILDMRTKTDL